MGARLHVELMLNRPLLYTQQPSTQQKHKDRSSGMTESMSLQARGSSEQRLPRLPARSQLQGEGWAGPQVQRADKLGLSGVWPGRRKAQSVPQHGLHTQRTGALTHGNNGSPGLRGFISEPPDTSRNKEEILAPRTQQPTRPAQDAPETDNPRLRP